MAENKELRVARIASIVIVLGGVLIALTVPSVVQGVKYLWQITAYFGIAFWGAIMWRRSNRYAVWASVIVTVVVTFITGPYFSFGFGWALEYQIAAYLPAGIITFILVAAITKPEKDEMLDKFYALLHTPVGEEQKLKDAGHEIMLEGESESAEKQTDEALEEQGHSLLVVDLLSLPKKFTFKRYSVDLKGFGFAMLFVVIIFAIGLITANIG